jgi:hypothetical protein
LEAGNKIWYKFPNLAPYDVKENVIMVTNSNSAKYIQEIKQSIYSFAAEIEWKNMWTLEEAGIRFSKNETLFLLRDEKGALGHIWFDQEYCYNLYVHPRRKKGTAERFTYHCFNFIPHKEIFAYADGWNKKAIKHFEKVGGIEISSYL